jgi:hypothetical protein
MPLRTAPGMAYRRGLFAAGQASCRARSLLPGGRLNGRSEGDPSWITYRAWIYPPPTVLERAVSYFSDDDRVVGMILGGSLAHGAADLYSDVDLYIVASDESFEAVFGERDDAVQSIGSPLLSNVTLPPGFHQPPRRRRRHPVRHGWDVRTRPWCQRLAGPG